MMPEYTANYNLIKPQYNETADIKVINENMDTIDGKLKENADGLSTHSSKAASTSASGHVQLQTTVDNSETTALTPKALNTHVAESASHVKPARIVIGTSTSGWTEKDCDYLCDGTADQTEINAAITALPATGGEVVILDGTYNITAKIDVTKDNVSIRGNGNATILKRIYNSSTVEGVITLTGRSGCKIANLQIEGNKTSYTNSNNCGIYLFSSSNNTITGNTYNNNDIGIYLFSSSNNTITGNTYNNNDVGISLGNSSNNTITGNTYNNNSYGIYLFSSSNNTITGNTCNNNSYGIYLDNLDNNTITGNTCNNNDVGIFLFSASNNNTITGNTYNNNNYGIYLFYSSNNNTITGNTCNNNNVGICLFSASNNTITGNTCIRGTGLPTDYTASQHTIQLKGTDGNYNLISSNNCMGKPVVVEGGTGNSAWGNKFDNTDDLP